MAKKLGFALGSGGSRGVAHVGFLKAMEENGIFPDYIAGTSMGAVVGSCYALGMSSEEMMQAINKTKPSELFDLSLNPLGNGALLRSNKMRKKLSKFLKKATFEQLKIPFCAVATDLVTGKTVVKKTGSVLDGVVASSTIPGIFKPIEDNGMVLVDGGVTCRVPIDEVRELGAEVVVAVDVLGKVCEKKRKYNMLSVLFRMVDIIDSELVEHRKKRQKPNLFLIPDLGDMSQYKFKDLKMAYEKGYELGIRNVKKIKQLITEE